MPQTGRYEENRMIREVTGDILFTQAQVIAHGIAVRERFDHGLALALRERWPSMARRNRRPIGRWRLGVAASASGPKCHCARGAS